ncbi:glycine betaine ABC transporter substrate-binding protein [Klenkia terrae]|uniref:Glycine betaine ABC transporter substrate-binding protein n=1 Tax=Klenkia terrae TaxID=1052259 RepID=A0ABU8E010_9ACTN|nr:glycine betaine ABC transporter substrate-binding protein [Klenkia terrae]SSC24393.1 ABC-type glycine betaine transport system, substrate-binding domain [Klenkia terrae]
MRTRARILTTTFALTAVLATAACGESGSSGNGGGGSDGGQASGDTCAPIADDQLVVMEDDKELQAVDNIIPALVTSYAEANPTAIEALNTVSSVLTTEDLVGLNAAVDVERQSAIDAAAAYVEDNDLGSGVTGSGAVTVGAASFTESQILANVYAGALNNAGFTATVQTVGQREAYLPALQAGQFQVFPEYVGTVAEYLDGNPDEAVVSGDLDSSVETLRSLGTPAGLTFGEPAEAEDSNAFAITKALQDELGGITTMSELAEACSDGSLILGATPECPTRPFCQIGLEDVYGFQFASLGDYDLGAATNQALIQGEISMAQVLSTDPILAQ